jgi:dsRNA-specific ribonuclease
MSNTFTYKGIRGKRFKYFLRQVLSLSNLNEKYYDILLDKESLKLYDLAFTHKSFDSDNNYEYLEFLGDTTLNKSIAWYLSRRFPQLNCPEGVKVLTRLKINLISKKSFASFAKQLFFWDFVSVDLDVRNTKMDKTLEDVFESFFGATEMILDSKVGVGVGYNVCYSLISVLLDTRNISLKYNDLFDSKTRLKEIFDFFGNEIGKLKYESTKQNKIHYVKVGYIKDGKDIVFIGEGSAPLKANAQQKAAAQAIEYINQRGYSKPLSDGYKQFCS